MNVKLKKIPKYVSTALGLKPAYIYTNSSGAAIGNGPYLSENEIKKVLTWLSKEFSGTIKWSTDTNLEK